MGKTATNQINRRFIFLKKEIITGRCLSLPRGYIHAYDNYFQKSFTLKPLGQSKPNFMCCLLGKREPKFCNNGLGHMTKLAAMPIYGNIFGRTQSPMILKHYMSYKRLKLYKCCINDDSGLTLTYSNSVAYTLESENC